MALCPGAAGGLLYLLHRNAAEVAANGIEVWVAENCSATSLDLAQRVEQGLLAAGVQNSRGVR